jgi:hypothetical protein
MYQGHGIFPTIRECRSQSPESRLLVPESTILGKQVHGGTTGIEVAELVAAVGWNGFHLTKLDGQWILSGTSYER